MAERIGHSMASLAVAGSGFRVGADFSIEATTKRREKIHHNCQGLFLVGMMYCSCCFTNHLTLFFVFSGGGLRYQMVPDTYTIK